MSHTPLIWIIDDDDLFIMITRNNIRKASTQLEIEVFHDGQESMDCLKERISTGGNLPDIILLDLNMPLADGWAFLTTYALLAADIRKKIQVYVCTSSIDPKDIHRAKEFEDVRDFKEKPLSTEVILGILKEK
ncbi:MAG: response regulator [Bacteroidia bacterium]|jgi:CheY-like chemotaxis protein